ncbi:hypothetical protein CHARACLAT_019173 [Characodon lateralis]|uniref:Uncharacterized protein n=1 Tax=Characodon lateralis TaxID=208331 RepID=A0ABU7EF71_9TELE|nr:hypothetical protein [Characodon lateralis]
MLVWLLNSAYRAVGLGLPTYRCLISTQQSLIFRYLLSDSECKMLSREGETTVPGLDAVSQKLPLILFTLVSWHCLLHCLHIFYFI